MAACRFLSRSKDSVVFARRTFSSLIQPQQQTLVRPPYVPPKKEAPLYRLESGEKLGTLELHHDLFGLQPRLDVLREVVVWQLAKKRSGTASTKNRGEVSGGGRKPWPQKKTGRPRHGSIRSPIWRGGGVCHGPRPKSYDYPLPHKVCKLGVRTALSIKYAQRDLFVVDSLHLYCHKTQHLLQVMDIYGWESVLFIDGGTPVDTNIVVAAQGLRRVEVLPETGLNVYSMLRMSTLVLSVGALRCLEERLIHDLDD